MKPTVEERFLRFAPPREPDACWLWTGAKFPPLGYGAFKVKGKMWRAHRWAWTRVNGPIPEGLDVLHRCDVPACVNPAHLFTGTDAVNMADKVAKGRQAKGATHGTHTRPETRTSGDDHWTRQHPERVPRGAATVMHTHPEGRRPGEANGNSKLSAEQVQAIRAEVAGGAVQAKVGAKYGVDQTAVSAIVLRKVWRHIP
jgi:hypothetical protein